MADETKAGALLLSQIGMFNEARLHWEKFVEPIIHGAINAIIDKFAEDNTWDVNFDLNEEEKHRWVAPPSWRLEDQDDDPEHKARFFMTSIKDEEDYWIALFCDKGLGGGEAGFAFKVEAKEFNGKNVWKAYAKKIKSDLVKELKDRNYRDKGDGEFFLPIHLDAEKLASAWGKYGEIDDNFDVEDYDFSDIAEEECFHPVRTALKTIEDSISTFDKIMKGFETK